MVQRIIMITFALLNLCNGRQEAFHALTKYLYRTDHMLKTLRYFTILFIWFIISIYLFVLCVIQIPSVQQFMGRQTSSILASLLDTEVSIKRVNIGFFNRIVLDDVSLYDQEQQPLLTTRRMAIRVDVPQYLTTGRLVINSAQLIGCDVHLNKKDSLTALNCQFIIDKLSSSSETDSSPINLSIGSLIIRDCNLSYHRSDMPAVTTSFDKHHISLQHISAHFILGKLSPDSVSLRVKRLTFQEQAGFQMDKLSFSLKANREACTVSDFILALPHSMLSIPYYSANYTLEPQYSLLSGKGIFDKDFKHVGSITTTLSTEDIRGILPADIRLPEDVITLSCNISGKYKQLDISKFQLSAKETDLSVDMNMEADFSSERPLWAGRFDKLSFTPAAILHLMGKVKGKSMDPSPEIQSLGNVTCKGTVCATPSHLLQAELSTSTRFGNIKTDVSYTTLHQLSGSIKTGLLALGDLNSKALQHIGSLGLEAEVKGIWEPDQPLHHQNLTLKANIPVLQYKDYTYRNIAVNGTLKDKVLSSQIGLEDANANVSLSGMLSLLSDSKTFSLQGSIDALNPRQLNLTSKWQDAVLAADIDVEFKGNSIDDMTGHAELNRLRIKTADTTYTVRQLRCTAQHSSQSDNISIKGDFIDASLVGKYRLSTIPVQLWALIKGKLFKHEETNDRRMVASTQNKFTFDATVTDVAWAKHLLLQPVSIQQPIRLHCDVNDALELISLNADLPAFSWNEENYREGLLVLFNREDKLFYDANILRIEDNNVSTRFNGNGALAEGILTNSFTWNRNDSYNNRGEINFTLQGTQYNNLVYKDSWGTLIHILPSSIHINGTPWQVNPASIYYTKDYLSFRQFSIQNKNQFVRIDGTATNHPTDTIKVGFSGVDVGYVLDLVNFHAVEFDGKAGGVAYLSQPFNQLAAKATVKVDNFLFEKGRMGTLHAQVHWDNSRKRIVIDALADDGQDAITDIRGYVAPGSPGEIDLGIEAKGTHIDFLHSFTSSFLESVGGHSYGKLNVVGPLNAINLVGKIAVEGSATVSSLGCRYHLLGDTLFLKHDTIMLNNIRIRDDFGQSGTINGHLSHTNLTRLRYDMTVKANNLMAYNFNSFGDNTFYGNVYVDGSAHISGHSGFLQIDVDATPREKTFFVYNTSSPEMTSSQDFITWRAKTEGPLFDMHPTDNQHGSRKDADTRNMHDDVITNVQEEKSDVFINFIIRSNKLAELRLLMDAKTGDCISLWGDGIIRASYHNKGPFNMYGTYVVNRGTYNITIQDILKKNFAFTQGGSILFGGDPYAAQLRLQAIHTVNGVSLTDLNLGNSFSNGNTTKVYCLMNISGQARAPQVDFDIDLPTVSTDEKQIIKNLLNSEEEMNRQVVYLLGIGRFYPPSNNNASLANDGRQSQTSLAMQSLLSGTISTQINNMLSSVIKSNNWNIEANISTGDEGWNNAEYEGMLSGRLLNNRLLINGQFGYRDNARTATSEFIGDFDVRYLLTPSGNTAIKVYNQTNDRYFTRSSLNTQGIGLILKKDFSSLKELFSFKKKGDQNIR